MVAAVADLLSPDQVAHETLPLLLWIAVVTGTRAPYVRFSGRERSCCFSRPQSLCWAVPWTSLRLLSLDLVNRVQSLPAALHFAFAVMPPWSPAS